MKAADFRTNGDAACLYKGILAVIIGIVVSLLPRPQSGDFLFPASADLLCSPPLNAFGRVTLPGCTLR
jgi:hypothetical protein